MPIPPPRHDWSPDRLERRRRLPRKPAEAPLVWVALAVGLGALGQPAVAWLGGGPVVCFVLAGVTLIAWRAAWSRSNGGASAWLLASLALVACGWSDHSWRWFPTSDLGRYATRQSEPVCVEAIVTAAVRHRAAEPPSPYRAIPTTARTVAPLRIVGLRDAQQWRSTKGRCDLIVDGRVDSIRPGDRVLVYGQLSSPDPALNPGQRDERRQQRNRRRLCRIRSEAPECIELREAGGAFSSAPTRLAGGAKSWAAGRIDARLQPLRAGLLKALTLGDTSGLSNDTIEAFRLAGVLHLLVVSGLHVGLVAGTSLVAWRLGLLPKHPAIVLAILAALAYAAVTGGRPPATRAALVVAAAGVAVLAGRRAIGCNSLAGAAVAVFVLSPGAWGEPGTRLSFLAAATLLAVAHAASREHTRPKPAIDRLVRRYRPLPHRVALRCGMAAGWLLVATSAVLVVSGPMLAREFHLFSPAALPLSFATPLLVGPMLVGALAWMAAEASAPALGSTATDWFALAPFTSCSAASDVLLRGVESANDSFLAGIHVAGPPVWWVGLWIVSVAAVAASHLFLRRGRATGLRLGLLLLALWFAPGLWRSIIEREELKVSFLSVGHGSAVLIEPPGGGALLYDAGALGSPERAADIIARVLWSRGIEKLDGVFLSHPDVDHYNALPDLLDRFDVAGVWTTGFMFPRSLDAIDFSGPVALRRLLERSGLEVHQLRRGQRLALGELEIEVLHPGRFGAIDSDNANSLVLGLEHEGRRVLLTGDLEAPGLDSLLEDEPYRCDLLAAPHHGSLRSDPPGLAEWCRPGLVVVSSGDPHPATALAYQQQGAVVRNTHSAGMVTVRLSREAVEYESYVGP